MRDWSCGRGGVRRAPAFPHRTGWGLRRRSTCTPRPAPFDPTGHRLTWGDETMTMQKIYSRTNPVEASENPKGKTVPQIDEALRDFAIQDTAHLRREAENVTRSNLRPESATEVVTDVNSLSPWTNWMT